MDDLSGVGRLGVGVDAGLCLVISVEGWLLVNILRQNGRMLLRLDRLEGGSTPAPAEGLPVGVAAPRFELTDSAAPAWLPGPTPSGGSWRRN